MITSDLDRRLQMLQQENRLATFKNWVFSDDKACSRLKLAEAGFYFVGDESEPDVVECFLCQKTLDGWEENDDPWSEHLKHSPNCQFAQLLCPEDALTYYQFLDIKAGLLKMIYKTIADSTEKKLKDKWEDAKKYMSRYLK